MMAAIAKRLAAVVAAVISAVTAAASYPEPIDSVLTIPAEVETVPTMAYAYREDIRAVRFAPDSRLGEIGDYAFVGCRNLREAELPSTVRSLGMGVFQECDLRRLTVPTGVRKIPRYMCAWNENLSDVSLPRKTEDIGSHAFAYCRSLRKIDVPTGVRHIGSNAFSFCDGLTEVELPATITELESYAFSECRNLRGVVLPANKSMLGEYLFSGCVSLEKLTELSPEPPTFDCGSPLHDATDTNFTERVRLKLAPGVSGRYREASVWREFFRKEGKQSDEAD